MLHSKINLKLILVENFQYEDTRRKIFSDLKDVSYYMKNKLKIINKKLENDELNLVIKNFDHRIK